MTSIDSAQVPRVGMFATVRNRRGVVTAVEPYDSEQGRIHLVHLEYKDDNFPTDEQLLWELEPYGNLLEPTALPPVGSTDAMPSHDFDALLRASRWTAATPFLDPDGEGPLRQLPISSPFHGALQVDDFQLVPLLKALRMPRVNLLIADDVGLGKTIEAGLILSELLLRRRIQRVLILTPASLRLQWRDEMWEKFSLPFDLVDRSETHALRRRLGMDASPWRSFNRIIASYHYLRQPDVLEQFLATCRTPEGSPHLPWDLLIVDECHNLMPSAFGEDSDLCKMLRVLAPQFEHRIFLSATPHNGHTRCFTGLLEILDPVRFSQTNLIRPAERERIQQVVLRRLKREINERTNPPKFCTRRPPHALVLPLSPREIALSSAFHKFRIGMKELVTDADNRRQRTGSFAVEILGKRLLSCPTAFAESWKRCKLGMEEDRAADESDVDSVRRTLRRETDDDREAQAREATATSVVGSWLKSVANDLQPQIIAIDEAIADMGLLAGDTVTSDLNPVADARFDAFINLIETLLRTDNMWRTDERLVVFTEYKTTLDYLVRRLDETYDSTRVLTLFGGMDEIKRNEVKYAFNDPSSSVRILLATDAAAEGLNLQQTARYLLHFDCPWNPSKLEQRNGRLDRHGQPRDVTIHHFVADIDDDLKFLAHVIAKSNEIREDLGSVNELFDEAAHRRLVQGEGLATVQADLDKHIESARSRAAIDADSMIETALNGHDAGAELRALAAEIDLDSDSLRETLESAMSIRVGRPQLDCSDAGLACRVMDPSLPGWSEVINDSLRQSTDRNGGGALPRIAFSPAPFVTESEGRQIFSYRSDLQLMHLSHPMLQRALSTLTRRRFPSTGDEVSRWTVRIGDVPTGVDALVLLSVEELAVNDLRETFHHWVHTLVFPIQGETLGQPFPHRPAIDLRGAEATHDQILHERARSLVGEVEPDLRTFLKTHAVQLSTALRNELKGTGVTARQQEDDRYRSRQGEISTLIKENTLGKLEREIAQLKSERQQGMLFDEEIRLDTLAKAIEEKQEEIKRRQQHFQDIQKQLNTERDRILRHLLPKRHAMSGDAQVFPVSIEVRLRGELA